MKKRILAEVLVTLAWIATVVCIILAVVWDKNPIFENYLIAFFVSSGAWGIYMSPPSLKTLNTKENRALMGHMLLTIAWLATLMSIVLLLEKMPMSSRLLLGLLSSGAYVVHMAKVEKKEKLLTG